MFSPSPLFNGGSLFQETQMFGNSSQSEFSSQRSSRSSNPSSQSNRPAENRNQGRLRLFDDENPVDSREICLALCVAAGRIGAAFYDPQFGQINIFDDVVESYLTCDVLKSLIAQIRPSNVIASAKQDEKVMFHLKKSCLCPASAVAAEDEEINALDTNNVDKPRLSLLRAWDFGYTTAKRRICTVVGNTVETNLGNRREFGRVNLGADQNETETRVRTACAINFDASCMVRSFGALLKYLNLKRLGNEGSLNCSMSSNATGENSQRQEEAIRLSGIYSIRKFTLEKTLLIDIGTFEGLQIFQQQYHPSVYKAGRSGSKEGLSLFNICDYCRSGPGSLELRRWFLRPCNDVGTLQMRLDAVEYLADDNNEEIAEAMSKTLQNVHHLTAVLNRMQVSKLSVRDWSRLYKTLTNCCRLGELVRMRQKRPELLSMLADVFGPVVQDACALLEQIIDFEACRKENRFIVKAGVDEELDARKAFYARLPDYMAEVAREEMLMVDLDRIDECTIVYMPLLGYLMTLPQGEDYSSETGSSYRNEGLQLVFVADDVAHYKSEATRRLDDEFGDVKFKIIDRETSIMLNVQNVILEQAESLLAAVQSAAQLDCLISLAMAAKTFSWRKPIITDENVINIEGGRHPLQEIVDESEQFVANPVRSGGLTDRPNEAESANSQMTTIRHSTVVLTPAPKVHLLTGPNASGKSVYLKQVGLLVYMAHVGCFVPAAKAEIGVLDGIFTRLRTLDSVTGGLSSFAIDVRQMSSASKQATGRSLILIDEFGKGTSTETGASLLAASLEYWLEKKDECPHVYVCSHIYGIIGILPQSPLLELLTMAVEQKREELVFLFKLVTGTIESSLAVYTAQAAGLPISTIQRAVQIFDNIKSGAKTRRFDMTEDDYQSEYQKMCRLVEQFLAIDLDDTTRPIDELLQEVIANSCDEGGAASGAASS